MKMDWSGMGSLLVFIFLVSNGIHSLKNPPSSGERGGLSLPWHDELCCDSPAAHLTAEEKPPEHKTSNDSRPLLFTQCYFKSEHHHDFSRGFCVDVKCSIREDWSTLNCELHSDQSVLSRTPTAISFQPESGTEGVSPSADLVICEGNSSLKCSLVLGATSPGVMVTLTIGNVSSSPVRLSVPASHVKPGAPVNLTHYQTIEGELVLTWVPPPGLWGRLRYEVRYSWNETEPAWTVLQVFGEPKTALDLDTNNYSLQIRCSNDVEPPVWSNWSQTYKIKLDIVTYLPVIVVAHPGEAVTIYCVFNKRTLQASSAQWILNLGQEIPSSQYHPVNQRVSQITVTPSSNRMYELLQCTKESHIPHSQILVQDAAINITCITNGDINTMDCSWKIESWIDPIFNSKWADLLCEEMERREKEGEELGSPGKKCVSQKSCTLQSLRLCHKLWLEMDDSIMSKPIYVSPADHVKPHTASKVRAVTLSSGVLSVSWECPPLPVQGVRCQFRYHGPSTNGQPEWRHQPPVHENNTTDEVSIPNACVSYAVQVRCLPAHGAGYWSDWSVTKYSAPQNSQAPERGPDFWRVFSDDPNGNQTTVTLLFEHLQTSDLPYCVEGMKIKHQHLNGSVTETSLTGLKSSHTFEWDHEPQTVTVATYNSVGRSANNFNVTLNRQVKRLAVRSFHVFLVNSSCVSVSWSVLESSAAPQSLVLQWTHSHPENHKSSVSWRRLSYTDPPVHVRGDFFGSEEYDFYLYPVFAAEEGEPVHTRAVKREPGAFMLLLIISFLSVVLLVTLVLSQNQMKKIVWKDVPNPNNCSWAKGVDFRKMDTFDHLLRAPDALPAWPLLLPAETISTVVIVDKTELPTSAQPPLDSALSDTASNFGPQDNEKLPSEDSMDNVLNPETTSVPSEILDAAKDDSAQSSVNYATLISDPKLKQHFQHGSGCSSCDEGNFSANNSDFSDSSHGVLWELESCKTADSDQRHSGSYNSVEEISESSDQEDDNKQETDLYYLALKGEDSEEGEEETQNTLLKSILSKENCSIPLLDAEEDSNEETELLSAAPCGLTPLYLPQFRTSP